MQLRIQSPTTLTMKAPMFGGIQSSISQRTLSKHGIRAAWIAQIQNTSDLVGTVPSLTGRTAAFFSTTCQLQKKPYVYRPKKPDPMMAAFADADKYAQVRNKKRRGYDMKGLLASKTAGSDDGQIKTLRTIEELRKWRKELAEDGDTLGFVPTMGALHWGHLSLAKKAAIENDRVVVSIYVNPTQFGVNEDLDAYPRTLDSDLAQLGRLNEELAKYTGDLETGRVSAVFIPTTQEMYPSLPPTSEVDGKGSFVIISPIGQLLEGASRPVFFRGVATVCMKLFNIIRPENVYFGQKDVQQTVIIKRMVNDFHLDTKVRIIPTERETDGLAMSSRNVYLGERRRAVAPILSKALKMAAIQIKRGARVREEILKSAQDFLDDQLEKQTALPASERVCFELDYMSLADLDSMEEIQSFDSKRGAILSAALKMLPVEELRQREDPGENGGVNRPVRLIDNIVIKTDGTQV